MEESLKIILEAVNRAQGELAATVKQIEGIAGATVKQRKAFEEADKVVQKHKGSLIAIGAALGAVAGGMLVLMKQALRMGDEFRALAEKTGVSIENLSTLSLVAKNANVEIGNFTNGLKFLARAAVESQVAGTEGAKAFATLGVSATGANGKLKDTYDLLLESADVFAAHADGAAKSALAMQIFGRAGVELIPLLNTGRQGIIEQQAAIRALGGEMSKDFGAAADQFNDRLTDLTTVLRGAAKDILTDMLPSLQKLVDLVIANKDTIVPAFKAIAIAVAAAAVAFGGFKVVALVTGFGQIIQLVPAMVTGLGLTAGAATAAGTAAAAAAISFGVAAVAIASLTLVVIAGIKAWEAWGAAQKEAAAVDALTDSTALIRDRLRKHTDDLKAAGKITAEEAAKIRKVLDAAAGSKDVDFQLAANRAVLGAIKDKVDAENRFASAAQVAAAELAKQSGAKPEFVDSEVVEAQLKLAAAAAEGQQAIGQATLALRVADQEAALAVEEAALERSLSRQGISVADYEKSREALIAKRISNLEFAANFEADLATEANKAKAAAASDPTELAGLAAQQTISEINLQTRLNEIAAQGEADRLAVTQQAVDATIEARARQLDQKAGESAAQSGADLAGQGLKSAQLEADLELRRISEFEFAAEQRALAATAIEEERARAVESANIEAEKNALKLEALAIGSAERNALELSDQLNHQNNLLAIEETASAKRIKLAADEQKAKRDILTSQLEATMFTLDMMTSAAQQYGKKGVAISKVTATASALIATYLAATQASAAVSGIPIIGPVLAVAAAAAAIAAGLANIAKINGISFEEGGLVPGAPSRRDNRLATVATGEYIFPSAAVSKMGPAWFAALHEQILSGRFPGFGLGGLVPRPVLGTSFAAGGLVGPGPEAAQAGGGQISVGFVNSRNAMRDFQLRDGIRLVVDQLEQRNNQVFS